MEQEKMRKPRKPNSSPMQIGFWLTRINPKTEKIYTEEEAREHIKSFRKSNVQYWTTRGYSESEAKVKVSEYQKENSRRGHKVLAADPSLRLTRIEYWLKKGYTEEEAKKKLSERQRTFTKEKCIEKYGEVEGLKRWKIRQQKWQTTLKSKPRKVIDDINKRKSCTKFFTNPDAKRDNTFFEKWKSMCESRGWFYTSNKTEALTEILRRFNTSVYSNLHGPEWFIDHVCPEYLYAVHGLSKEFVIQYIFENRTLKSDCEHTRYNSYGILHKTEEGKILRSTLEWLFYELCKKHNVTITDIDSCYPNSRKRFDFKIENCYIEIAGLMCKPSYYKKMLQKRQDFGAFVLTDSREFEDFIVECLIKKNNDAIDYYLTRPL